LKHPQRNHNPLITPPPPTRFTEALALAPDGSSAYMLHSNLSATNLQLGNKEEALAHAQTAVARAPRGFHKVGWLACAVDVLKGVGQMAAGVDAAALARLLLLVKE